MNITLISYSNLNYKKHQKRLTQSANRLNCFKNVIEYESSDIDKEFYESFRHILEKSRGAGYWLWKSYIINDSLSKINEDDYIFYCDTGVTLIKNIKPLVYALEKSNQDIMGFELPLIEYQWTKKELFTNLNCNDDKYYFSNQILASFIIIKNTKKSRLFFSEFLNECCKAENITDINNSDIQSEDFIDHRHDQSIFSLLYKKHNYTPFRDPSQYGRFPEGYSGLLFKNYEYGKLISQENRIKFRKHEFINSEYPMVLFHGRGKLTKSFIKYIIYQILIKFRGFNL